MQYREYTEMRNNIIVVRMRHLLLNLSRLIDIAFLLPKNPITIMQDMKAKKLFYEIIIDGSTFTKTHFPLKII